MHWNTAHVKRLVSCRWWIYNCLWSGYHQKAFKQHCGEVHDSVKPYCWWAQFTCKWLHSNLAFTEQPNFSIRIVSLFICQDFAYLMRPDWCWHHGFPGTHTQTQTYTYTFHLSLSLSSRTHTHTHTKVPEERKRNKMFRVPAGVGKNRK